MRTSKIAVDVLPQPDSLSTSSSSDCNEVRIDHKEVFGKLCVPVAIRPSARALPGPYGERLQASETSLSAALSSAQARPGRGCHAAFAGRFKGQEV